MSVVILRRRKLNPKNSDRPTHCPYCGCDLFQRWGEVSKSIKEKEVTNVSFYRYRCELCNRTFRDYPGGFDRSYYSQGTKQLAALIWALGYSYRDIVNLFQKFEINLSRSTVWREGQALETKLKGRKLQNYRKIFTIDQNYIPKISSNFGVVVIVEVGEGQYAILGTLDESDPRSVQSWLKPLVKDAEVEVVQRETGILDLLHQENTAQIEQIFA